VAACLGGCLPAWLPGHTHKGKHSAHGEALHGLQRCNGSRLCRQLSQRSIHLRRAGVHCGTGCGQVWAGKDGLVQRARLQLCRHAVAATRCMDITQSRPAEKARKASISGNDEECSSQAAAIIQNSIDLLWSSTKACQMLGMAGDTHTMPDHLAAPTRRRPAPTWMNPGQQAGPRLLHER
jgi:hypothetical protein